MQDIQCKIQVKIFVGSSIVWLELNEEVVISISDPIKVV